MSALNFNPVQDGAFWGCSRMGGGIRPPSLKPVTHTHISLNDETCNSYTLHNEDPKIYESCDTPIEFC